MGQQFESPVDRAVSDLADQVQLVKDSVVSVDGSVDQVETLVTEMKNTDLSNVLDRMDKYVIASETVQYEDLTEYSWTTVDGETHTFYEISSNVTGKIRLEIEISMSDYSTPNELYVDDVEILSDGNGDTYTVYSWDIDVSVGKVIYVNVNAGYTGGHYHKMKNLRIKYTEISPDPVAVLIP